MTDLDNYYRLVGYLRGEGLSETQAYSRAEEVIEEIPMSTFNIVLIRRSAITISFQAESFNEAVTKSAETITGWRDHDRIERVFISELDQAIGLLEYRPEEVVELATPRATEKRSEFYITLKMLMTREFKRRRRIPAEPGWRAVMCDVTGKTYVVPLVGWAMTRWGKQPMVDDDGTGFVQLGELKPADKFVEEEWVGQAAEAVMRHTQ